MTDNILPGHIQLLEFFIISRTFILMTFTHTILPKVYYHSFDNASHVF